MEYGCIAECLGHSFSKAIHAQIDDYAYTLREVPCGELGAFMAARDFQGINVTIPYKQDVIPYLDYVSETAQAIGAVNTIRNRDGKLYGYNTDFGGMTALLRRMGLELTGKKVLVLGTGGTSRTAVAVAQSLGASQVLRVSRAAKPDAVTYEDAYALHTDAQIILNTTPSGMFPEIGGCPIRLDGFTRLEGVMDAVYNPLRTNFVQAAASRGIPAQGGLYMLVAQAVLAAEIFTEKQYAADLCETIYQNLLHEKENLVFIGMPGSGKTTIAKGAAEQLNRQFIDLDDSIVQKDGRPIPQIFREDGEGFFRDLESAVVRKVASQSGLVIATGGGCILREENVRYLRMNGRIVRLDRPLSDLLPTDDRPTADSVQKMEALYRVREPLYRAAADCSVTVGSSVPENIAHVVQAFLEAKT